LAPGAFIEGGYNLAFINNNNYATDRNQHVFWVGVKYSVTPSLDIAGAYYGVRQEYFTVGTGVGTGAGTAFSNVPGAGVGSATQAANCAINSASSSGCAGTEDMFSVALDWRFARHVDLYAGVSYQQKSGGLANGYVLSSANGTLTGNSVITKISNYDPGFGLRYQF
jgi:predicted porin